MFANETVYGCDGIGTDEDAHVMSDRVQTVATNIYKEFERMIPSYGEDVVKEMMPHIVNVLESLDLAFKENQEREAELELCKDDNEQLMSQYEREKQLRKNADQKLLAIEDLIEEEKKDTSQRLESYKLTIKAHELKAKNAQDHIVRLEEKEAELKREYGRLHDRYNDLLKRHMECVEKSKMSMTESMFDSMPKNFQLPILRSISNISNKEESRAEYDPLQHLGREAEKREHLQSMERDVNTDTIPVTEMGTDMSALSPLGDPKNKKKIIKPAAPEDEFFDDDDDDDDELLGQIVNPAEFSSSGMSKEIENLILENTELLATKNALNVVKDDLIARLDETMSEQEILKEELKATQNLRDQLREQVIEQEAELRNFKEALDSERKSHNEDGHDELSMAQRKRFTRVEMARVLMERNQYKERLMELQEAVRWTEMIRASREHPDLLPGSHHNSRKKSSLWNYFERLFVRRNDPPRRVASLAAVRYNAPTSPRRENLRLRADLSEKRRKTSEDQYKTIKAHVKKDDGGRIQAYGWSLPSSSSSLVAHSDVATPTRTLNHVTSAPVISQPETGPTTVSRDEGSKPNGSEGIIMTCGGGGDGPDVSPCASSGQRAEVRRMGRGMLPVPVPIYCKPLHKADASVKLWCGAVAFDDSTPDPQCRVWICFSDAENKSYVMIVDARTPDVPLDRFQVSDEHVLCETYVPGACDADVDLAQFTTDGIKVEEAKGADDNINKEGGKMEDQEAEEMDKKVFRCDTQFRPASPGEGSSADSLVTLNQNSMWLGSQIGRVYVHQVNSDCKDCIVSFMLQDSVFAICHLPGRVFLALANGQVIVFCRSAPDGAWNLSHHYAIRLGSSQYSVRCMCVVNRDTIWCACRNKIYVLNATNLTIERTFEAHARVESQIRQMAFSKEGVWVSIRLDSTLRLFDAHTCQHLQDVDVEPYVSKMLGTGKLGFSFIRITCLMAACNRLWIGTGNGVIICVPLLESGRPFNSDLSSGVYKSIGDALVPGPGGDRNTGASASVVTRTTLPYCSMAQAQLSFHGYKDAVKFFVCLPDPQNIEQTSAEAKRDEVKECKTGEASPSSSSPPPGLSLSPPTPPPSSSSTPSLVMSGGEGYVDFRMGSATTSSLGDTDEELDSRRRDVLTKKVNQSQQEVKNHLSHIIVWHVTPARLPAR